MSAATKQIEITAGQTNEATRVHAFRVLQLPAGCTVAIDNAQTRKLYALGAFPGPFDRLVFSNPTGPAALVVEVAHTYEAAVKLLTAGSPGAPPASSVAISGSVALSGESGWVLLDQKDAIGADATGVNNVASWCAGPYDLTASNADALWAWCKITQVGATTGLTMSWATWFDAAGADSYRDVGATAGQVVSGTVVGNVCQLFMGPGITGVSASGNPAAKWVAGCPPPFAGIFFSCNASAGANAQFKLYARKRKT